MHDVLITGGAGFIGKRLAMALRGDGHEVTVFDNFHPQVHKSPEETTAALHAAGVRVIAVDVRDADALRAALDASGATVIVHLAAETGTGQSYDLPARYCDVNIIGTANLVEAVRAVSEAGTNIERILLAGSRAVYGEGACKDAAGRHVTAVPRLARDLEIGDFAPKNAAGDPLTPIPSKAAATSPAPASIYASTKLMQEYILSQGLAQTGIACGILRLQNVYGAGQSLNNPYTGVLSIFAQQLLDGKSLNIFEDGEIVRDFVHVSDVVAAFRRMCRMSALPTGIIDIGSGQAATILEVACQMIDALGLSGDRHYISGQFRPGDIRHAVADISDAREELDWEPAVSLREGLEELLDWARNTQ